MSISQRHFIDTQISEIGLGAWALGGDWGEIVSESDALATIETALNNGVNFIDTADVYGAGRSETLIGHVLKTHRAYDSVYVATKTGRFEGWNDSFSTMENHIAASLKRLRTDRLDLVQLHCIPFETLKAGIVFDNLRKLQEKQLIGSFGVSVETMKEGLFCIEQGIASLQIIFNIFRQNPIDTLFAKARENKVGIIARVPLASGILSGKFTAQHVFHSQDHRSFNANGEKFNVGETFAGVPFSKGVELMKKITPILKEHSVAPTAQLALRWILDFPEVSTVIPGAKSPQQILENIAASHHAPLSAPQHAQLRELYEKEIIPLIRGAY